jgi:hypothetical protein
VTFGGAARAETCLAAPKAASPQGSRWYYRIERPSLRKCWHLVQKDQTVKSAAAPTAPQRDLDEADEPASAPAAKMPSANVPAASTMSLKAPAASAPAIPPQAEVPPPPVTPIVKNLVTRNVSNTDDTAQPPPDPSTSTMPRTDTPGAPAAPAQTMSNQRAAPPAAEPPAVQAAAAPEKASPASSGGGPSLFLLLAALAILGLLAGAAFLVTRIMRRRADVLNRLAEAEALPLEAAPELAPDADAPTFAPLPPMAVAPSTDDVDEALRRFARNFRRSAA